MQTASRVHARATQQGVSAGERFFLEVGLLAGGSILLARSFYLVTELLVLLAALAVMFLVGTGGVILYILVQEYARWSLCKFKDAKQATLLSLRGASAVGMPKLALPSAIQANPEVRLTVGVCGAQVKNRS